MPEITVDHILQACEWAKTASEAPQPIDGQKRRYDQGNWDCGTKCCIWGAASILSGNGPAASGPPDEWAATDAQHALLAALMKSSSSTPDQIAAVASKADLRYAILSAARLCDADLSGADLRAARLRDADLSGADLRGADLRGADLNYAILRDARLCGANLRGANLRGARLRDARLCGADLSGADLSTADLSGADLSDARLRGAVISLGNRRCLIR